MSEWDAVFVGSGINSLVGATLLARAGWKVCVVERNPVPGGNIRSEELTLPGFHHDVLSGWHPLFTGSPAYAELRADLESKGLEYVNTELPTGVLLPDQTAVFLSTDEAANVAEFEGIQAGDGESWRLRMQEFLETADIAFGMLGTNLWSVEGLAFLLRSARKLGRRGSLEFTANLLSTCRHWLEQNFASPQIHALLSPWVLHTGLGPDSAGSGYMTQVIAAALQMGGMPIPRGGGFQLVRALVELIEEQGGRLETDAAVRRILVEGKRAVGVETESGARIRARRAVLCSVTPTQLYRQLLESSVTPSWARESARRFRYGRADMQIHLALSEPPRWPDDPRFLKTAIFHVTPGLNAVSRAVNEADRGLLPAQGTIVLGQPTAVDSSRAPKGCWIFWIQLQELPSYPLGDAAGRISIAENRWNDTLKERYADRIVKRLTALIPNLESAMQKRVVLSPADLEAANVNLVGGDPYAGDCSLDQFFLWRPLKGLPGHRTPVDRLFHIGASTHPGPGLHGTSGYLAARHLLKKRLWKA